jgi:uncharacterized protein YndB with AHSA1/START domain
MKNCYTIEIDAAPEAVFRFLDNPDNGMKWLPNITENENLEETDEKVGSRFRQVYVENGRRMEMFGTITEYEQDRRMAMEITGDLFDLDVDYRLEDLDGRTKVIQNSEVHFKGMMKIMGFFMGLFSKLSSKKREDPSFAKLKELIEAENA